MKTFITVTLSVILGLIQGPLLGMGLMIVGVPFLATMPIVMFFTGLTGYAIGSISNAIGK